MLRINKPIRLIELFGGIGSQTMALRDIGANFEHYRLVEFDKYAIASYNAIHGTAFETMDIRNMHGKDLGISDKDKFTYLLTYSFPCTDLSVAGAMKGMSKKDWEAGKSTRSGLLWEVERILKELKDNELPDIMVMENVPQVHGKKNLADFNSWLNYLSSRGYKSFWKDLNAKDFGIPQDRNRCFCVSIHTEKEVSFEFPKPVELTSVMKDYLEESVDEKYYVNNEKAKKLLLELEENGVLSENREQKAESRKQKAVLTCYVLCKGEVFEKETDIATTLMARDYKGLANRRGNAVIIKEGLFPTVNTAQGGDREPMIIEETRVESRYRIRKLTPKECWRLMGYTDEDFEKAAKVNSNTQLYKQAGNAIVKQVLMAIFSQMNIKNVKAWNEENKERTK